MKTAAKILGGVFVIVVAVLVSRSVVVDNHNWSIARADVEIRQLSSALEAYKSDHGHYPSDPATTEQLKSNGPYDPNAYAAASAFLCRALSGSDDQNGHNYVPDFRSKQLQTDKGGVTRIIDPWGNFVGYSTFKAVHPESSSGHNSTFDLWSTGRDQSKSDPVQWIKNW